MANKRKYHENNEESEENSQTYYKKITGVLYCYSVIYTYNKTLFQIILLRISYLEQLLHIAKCI